MASAGGGAGGGGGGGGGGNDGGVLVPLIGTEGEAHKGVHILPSDLPDEEGPKAEAQLEQILGVLQGEIAHPKYWMAVAEMYYRKGQLGLFQRLLLVLLEGISSEDSVKEHIYGEGPEAERKFFADVVKVYNKLASERAMAALAARRARDEKGQREAFDDAKRFFEEAGRARGGDYDHYEEETMALQGWAILTGASNWEGGATWLKTALETAEKGKRTNLLAALGLAVAHFNDAGAAGANGQDGALQAVRKARKLFGKVLAQYPACPPDVRLGFGLCCYRLGEMDRARAAFQRTLAMAPGHKTALLALARTELAEADPKDYLETLDRVVRMQTAAYAQDQGDAVALNSLATYYLHKWFPLPMRAPARGLVEGQARVSVQADGSGRYVKFEQGDLIRIGSAFTARVVEASDDGSLLLNREYHSRGQEAEVEEALNAPNNAGSLPVYRKNFREALRLAERAMEGAELPGVRAEACYLKACVLHQLDDFSDALAYYRQACEAWPDLAPAQFGLAQMLAARSRQLQLRERREEAQQVLGEAVAALTKVLDRAPNDPDALTLLGLLLAERPGAGEKQQALERLKKAVELQPDVTEAWVALAQVHQVVSPGADSVHMQEALRCLLEAERLYARKREAVPAAVLSNLGALLHVQGRAGEAQGYYVRALEAFARTGRGGLGELERQYLVEEQPIVHAANGVFWRWEAVPGGLTVAVPAFGGSEAAVVEGDAAAAGIKTGEHVKLVLGPGPRDGFVSEVVEAAGGSLKLKHAFLLPSGVGEGGKAVPVARKASRGLLRHETLPTVFNLAMIQQDQGEVAAARELFVAITRQYPSYVAAYAKLGLLAHAAGKGKEAQEWLEKAQKIAPRDKDVAALRGKMEQDSGKRDHAQRHFEPLNKEGDSYAMVALGNLYFLNAMTVPDKAHHMVHARTYHSKVLKKHPGNIYAAHGLGLVLAEEFGKVEDARAVLQAVREKSGDKPDEVLVNIAHLFTAQGQRNAAIHCYETFLKKRPPGTTGGSGAGGGGDPALLHGKVLEYVAHAHFLDRRYEAGLRAELKATHLHPTRPQGYCNLGLLLEEGAMATFKRVVAKETKTALDARRAEQDIHAAIALYSRRDAVQCYPKARERSKFLQQNVPVTRTYVLNEEQRLREEAEVKAAQARRVAEELEKRAAAQRAQEEEKERQREAARAAAMAREEELRRLTSQWAQEPKEEAKRRASAGKGGRAPASDSEGEDNGSDSDVDDPLNRPSAAPAPGAATKPGKEGKKQKQKKKKPSRVRRARSGSDASSSSSGSSSSGSSSSSSGSSSDSDSDSSSSSSGSDRSLSARERRQQQMAAEAAAGGEGEGSDDEAYGIRSGMDVVGEGEGEESRKRKAAGEGEGEEGGGSGDGGGGPKKRRVQREGAGGESSSDEDELDLGPPTATATSAPPAAAAAPAVAEGAEASVVAAEASPAGGGARRRVAVDDDEEEEE